MSLQDVAVLVVAGLAVVGTAAWSIRDQRTWAGRRTAQLVAGLVCGVAAALAVAVPFVDVVPDAEEGVVAAGGVAAVAIIGAGAALGAGSRTRRPVIRSRGADGGREPAGPPGAVRTAARSAPPRRGGSGPPP